MQHNPDLSLADVLPAAAAAIGVDGFDDRLDIGSTDVVVVLLVDGLGATAIEEHEDVLATVAAGRGGSVEAGFPTTTATGLATLGTGLPSGTHGIVGASFWLPDVQEVLSPLHWGSSPAPVAVQPEKTVFEAIAAYGAASVAIGPAAYAGSGLSKAVLRGARYVSAESADERIEALAYAIEQARPLVVYLYWPALDRAGHEFGMDSSPWLDAAADVDALVAGVLRVLPMGGKLVVTADHGMLDAGERLWVEDEPLLYADVRLLAGEPRMRHVYADSDRLTSLRDRWESVLAGRARVWSREEAIGIGLFGATEPDVADRIGDLVVVCEPGLVLGSRRADRLLSSLPGQHGGLSDIERRVPGIILDRD